MKKSNKKQSPVTDPNEEVRKLTEEILRQSKQRLEEAKKMLEETNKFFSQSNDDVSFDRLSSLGYTVDRHENKALFFSLSKNRIKKIPQRSTEWFTNPFFLNVLAYSVDGNETIFIRGAVSCKRDILFRLQSKGYRFIEYTDDDYLAIAKDCGSCHQANTCPMAMQTSKMCPATEKTTQGLVRLSISKAALDTLVKVYCKN